MGSPSGPIRCGTLDDVSASGAAPEDNVSGAVASPAAVGTAKQAHQLYTGSFKVIYIKLKSVPKF